MLLQLFKANTCNSASEDENHARSNAEFTSDAAERKDPGPGSHDSHEDSSVPSDDIDSDEDGLPRTGPSYELYEAFGQDPDENAEVVVHRDQPCSN